AARGDELFTREENERLRALPGQGPHRPLARQRRNCRPPHDSLRRGHLPGRNFHLLHRLQIDGGLVGDRSIRSFQCPERRVEMENLLAMIRSREIPLGAFHEPQNAAGTLPADPSPRGTVGKMPAAPWRCRLASRCVARPLIASLLLLSFNTSYAEDTNKVQQARLKISGFGLLGNRELKRTIRRMSGKKAPPEFYDANFVEDAALIIVSTLNREGYLAPHISARLTLSDGRQRSFEWDKDIDTVVAGPLAAKKVQFRVRRGVRFYYRRLSIEGLKSLSQSEAKAFFVETGFLVSLKSTRIYTPSRLDSSIGDLTEALARKGFEHASVKVAHFERNEKTGAIGLEIAV